MTSVEVPYSIASALPTLTVLDITNEVRRELAGSGRDSGIAYVSPLDDVALVRVQERESGFFCDLEDLLTRLVPQEEEDRERMLCMLLGPRTEQIPFSGGQLCLGRWQRILLVDFAAPDEPRWNLTLLA
ncbi:MAG TPA: YjbQ family protein [Solirubrobacteraceae bacterium]|nr:YjbQ family protein [Solirubrobacteraceae bacterium]